MISPSLGHPLFYEPLALFIFQRRNSVQESEAFGNFNCTYWDNALLSNFRAR